MGRSVTVRQALGLALAPNRELPWRRVWPLLVGAVLLPLLGWLLSEDDEPLDLGGDD